MASGNINISKLYFIGFKFNFIDNHKKVFYITNMRLEVFVFRYRLTIPICMKKLLIYDTAKYKSLFK